MNDWEAIEVGVRNAVASALSGLTSLVYFGLQHGAPSEMVPRASITFAELDAVGGPVISAPVYDADTDKLVETVGQQMMFELRVQTFAPRAVGAPDAAVTAWRMAARMLVMARTNNFRDALRALGIAVLDIDPVQRLPSVVSGRWEDSALITLRCAIADSTTEAWDWFNKISLQAHIHMWPMLLSAPLDGELGAGLERDPANPGRPFTVTTDPTSKSPLLIDSGKGWKARRFDRSAQASSTALGGIFKRMPAADIARFMNGPWTFQGWVRREVVNPLGGNNGYLWRMRPWYDFNGSAFFALQMSLDHTTGAISINTQNRVGATLNADSSSFAGIADIGTWHFVQARKTLPNGIDGVPVHDLWIDGAARTKTISAAVLNYNVEETTPGDGRVAVGGSWSYLSGDTLSSAVDASLARFRFFGHALNDAQIAQWYAHELISR